MTEYIIGGGLSGLVAAYYNPEYTVITPEFGGFIDSKFGRAFVVLHATDAMCELFDELGLRCFKKRIQIGYNDPIDGVKTSFMNKSREENFARRYVERKLPRRMQPGKDLELSAPGDSWEALFVDSSIVDALSEHVNNVRFGFVEGITEDEIRFQPHSNSPESLEWDKIVSTLPATIFRDYADVDWELDHEPTTYAEIPREHIPKPYLEEPWDILYNVDHARDYHRVVRNMLSSRYYVECLGNAEVRHATDRTVNSVGVISDEDLDAPYPGIEFLGRYAEWQHDVRIDHVIERAKEGFNGV